jgi:hypothetical protein
MSNSIMQKLDLRVQVVYPLDYIETAIPPSHPAKNVFIKICIDLMMLSDPDS